jgi:phosphoribosylaminoimidazole carboxylase/phosphoribosylaminoimidazole-succinocarboxamide synthase
MANDVKPQLGATISEGKTKRIIEVKGDPSRVVLAAKDDITAGDGAKHDVIPDKGKMANQTTCNVFRLLKAAQIPVAFDGQGGADWFSAPRCRMLPYEVVVRREAHGSYLKRNLHLAKGQIFSKLLVEFYLKTKDRRWKNHELTCDDPLMSYTPGGNVINLFNPAKPLAGQTPFLVLKTSEVFDEAEEWKLFPEMMKEARRTFLVLEKAWQLQGRRLVDMKVEFGIDTEGHLLLADVIDNDSWRVLEDGAYIDKQVYRDGGELSDVVKKYRLVEEITSRFTLPRQRVIIWSGSVKDDVSAITDAVKKFSAGQLPTIAVACSVHKEPVRGMLELSRLVQEVPDTVVVAFVGMSNGAGPTLSAGTTVPVITVPAGYEKFVDDVWSSLRVPSNVPVMTVLNPVNAALAAVGILALRNPLLYACLRFELEERAMNVVGVE